MKRSSIYSIRWQKKNPEKKKIYDQRYRAKHRLRLNAENGEYQRKHKHMRGIYKFRGLLRRMGLTEKDYERICREQGGSCPICKRLPKERLVLDHDHRTGLFRGLICTQCNRGLGHFLDDLEILKNAISYLETQGRA